MLPKIIVIFFSLVLILLSFYPLTFIRFYIVVKTLLQPFANKHLTLIGNIPINSPLPLILFFYSYLTCFFKKNFSLFIYGSIYLHLLLFWSLLSLVNSISLYTSIAFSFKILTAISTYLLSYNAIESTDDFKKIHKTIVFLAVITALYGIYQLLLKEGGQSFYGPLVRVKSVLVGANEFGIFLSLSIISNLILISIENDKKYKISLILIILAYIFALNRGSWIAISGAFFLSYFFFRDKVKFKNVALPIIILFLVFSPIIILRFLQLETHNTFLTRINFWKSMLALIPQHPFLGFGIGTTEYLFQSLVGRKIYPHNDFLRLFFEIGLGVIFYILFLIKSLLFFIKNRYIDWKINYLFVVLMLYWFIITIPQNIINDVINFPMFMCLLASGLKYNYLLSKVETIKEV